MAGLARVEDFAAARNLRMCDRHSPLIVLFGPEWNTDCPDLCHPLKKEEVNAMGRLHFNPAACSQLEHYTSLEYILLGDLRDVLEEPANRHTRGWLVAILDALLDTLPRQLALKEESGYLNEVLDEYPSWYRQVEELQNEERLLFLSLQALRDRLETSESYAHAADRVKSAVRHWMTRLTAHHRHETRILQTAINLEVGGGD
jgi:hypothetical protein